MHGQFYGIVVYEFQIFISNLLGMFSLKIGLQIPMCECSDKMYYLFV